MSISLSSTQGARKARAHILNVGAFPRRQATSGAVLVSAGGHVFERETRNFERDENWCAGARNSHSSDSPLVDPGSNYKLVSRYNYA